MPALTVSGFSIDQFLFYGWLSPKKERRRAELRQLMNERRTIVLMDTPYRLMPLMRDLAETFGSTRNVCVAYNLTMPDEHMFYGSAEQLHKELSARELKGEFVVVIEGRTGKGRSARRKEDGHHRIRYRRIELWPLPGC